ncbi:MAG: hypothetical protein ACK559_32235 [bacterium]
MADEVVLNNMHKKKEKIAIISPVFLSSLYAAGVREDSSPENRSQSAIQTLLS